MARNPRILWIAHFLPWPPHGGSAQRSYHLMREISADFDLSVIGYMQRPHQPTEREQMDAIRELRSVAGEIRAFRIPSDYSRLAWLTLLGGNLFSREPYSVWKFSTSEFQRELADLLEGDQFDIVYADTIATASSALAARGRAKLVLNHHNVESALLERRGRRAPTRMHRWYLEHQANKLEKWEAEICPRFDLNQTVSELDADVLRGAAPGARYEVVPNGTDTDYFKPAGKPASGPEMVFAGGGTWMPNRDAMTWFAEEIFPLIAAEVPEVVMHVIGNRPPEAVINASRLDPRIRVHGFVPDIRPYLERASVYVVPMRVGGGTRLKVLDAFAAGKAVVSTTIGAEGIQCRDGVHLRLADSAPEFARTVTQLLRDPAARHPLEVNGRELAVKRYSWSVIGSDVRSLYRDLVG